MNSLSETIHGNFINEILQRTDIESDETFSKYIITDKTLGSGAFAIVKLGYLASNKKIRVAVKIIRIINKPRFNEKLLREIQILMKFDHPNIVRMYDVVQKGDLVYLFLEFCNEGDLHRRIEDNKYYTEEETIPVLYQICSAMCELHNNNIIHRDLKLANILQHDGITKLSDFGFAKELATNLDEPIKLTRVGTPIYMSPQILNNKLFSSKTDVWSLGILTYEMLFLKTPWYGEDPSMLARNIVSTPLGFKDGKNKISSELKDLIRKMLMVDEEKRIGWDEILDAEVFKEINQKFNKIKMNKAKIEEDYSNGLESNFKNFKKDFKKNEILHDDKQKKKGFMSFFCCSDN